MATFKIELTGDEATALRQIIEAAPIRGGAARVVATIQDKFDAAADIYNKNLKESSPPKPPGRKSPRRKGGKGGGVSS